MRFIVEFWRANPVVGLGLTEYQWISVVLIIVGTALFYIKQQHIADSLN
jgi:prolipoprotein diacylglyceryltransferase